MRSCENSNEIIDIGIIKSKEEFKKAMELAIYGNLDLYSDGNHENDFKLIEGETLCTCCSSWKYFSNKEQDIANITTFIEEAFDKKYLKMPFDQVQELIFDMKNYHINAVWAFFIAIIFGLRYFWKKEKIEFEVSSDNGEIFTNKDINDNYDPYGEFNLIVSDFVQKLLNKNNKKVYIKYSENLITVLINQ